jgi:hypothetical protein
MVWLARFDGGVGRVGGYRATYRRIDGMSASACRMDCRERCLTGCHGAADALVLSVYGG